MTQENSVCMQSVDMDLTCLPPGNTSLQQACVVIENSQTVTLNAPKGSATMKSSEKGIGMSLHKFSFSQIFGPDTTQAELFENTVKNQMNDFLDGKNALIFSYGVTNAGKTFTIQGTDRSTISL
uniref:Kinesin motor domain-containing protein n=1 Tax=Oreochromis aureus TaxID=47969 RepID=A0AAZ1XG58_OREAU